MIAKVHLAIISQLKSKVWNIKAVKKVIIGLSSWGRKVNWVCQKGKVTKDKVLLAHTNQLKIVCRICSRI